MIEQSDLALAAWQSTERLLDAVVTINKIDYKATDLTSIDYDSGGFTGDTFSIGSNYENSVSIKFAHLVEGLQAGMTLIPKVGIKTANGYEYSSLGVFVISDEIQMDRNNDETTIKAYDQMCLLEGTYTSKLSYPAKVVDVVAEIANMVGVPLNTSDISRLPVLANLPSAIKGQTYRNAIGMLAQFYVGFATFDRDGKLTIRVITEPDYVLDPSQYEQGGLTKNEVPYKIGGIECDVTTSTSDSSGGTNETTTTLQVGATSGSQVKLANSLMTMDRLQDIWTQIKDITFYPFSLKWFGNPAIEAGDWLTLQDTKGNKFNVPNNGYTMTFDGSLSAVSKADQTATASSSYVWRGQLSQQVADLGGRIGASGNYIYGAETTDPPLNAKFNDLWYKQNGNKTEMWTYERQSDGTGEWVLTVSDLTGSDIKAQVDEVGKDAMTAVTNAENAVAIANGAVSTAGFANDAASKAQVDAGTAMTNSLQVLNTANGLSDKITTNTASIDNNTKLIALKANQTDVDSIAGRVTTAEGALKVMNDQVAQSVTHSELTSTLDGYATQSWTQGQITTTANTITSTVSSVQTQVNNSAVGTNLFHNTRLFEGWDVWGGSGGGKGFAFEPITVDGGAYKMAHIYNNADGQNSDAPVWSQNDLVLESGKTYTVSVWAHHLGTTDQPIYLKLWINWASNNVYQQVILTHSVAADWTRYAATFVAGTGGQVNKPRIVPYFTGTSAENVKGSIYLLKPKLEIGGQVTDYSTNPADSATVTALSTVEQTVKGIQTTVSDPVNGLEAKQTLLSNQYTSLIGTLGQKNLVTNATFQNWNNPAKWIVAAQSSDRFYTTPYAWANYNGYSGIGANIPVTDTATWPHLQSQDVLIGDTTGAVFSASVYVSIDWVETYVVLDISFYDSAGTRIKFYDKTISTPGNWQLLKMENCPAPADAVKVHIELHVHDHGHVAFICPMLVQGATVGQFVSDNPTSSQITQLQDDINLRVTKNGVVNAVNVSTEGIQIYGNKLHITATTYIDNAVIKSAMIDTITADKITTGTLNAANVNLINLNASRITTGTLTGTNLQINLNTGVVTFQSGRIHNSTNTIDINIDSGYMSVANGNTRVMLKNGEMQFVQPGLFDTSSDPYLRISNVSGGQSVDGATFSGRKYAVLTNQDNSAGGGIFDAPVGEEQFSGISTGYGVGLLSTGWHMTKVGGADRGVVISGGKKTSYNQYWQASPSIVVGGTNPSDYQNGGKYGTNIIMDCNYLYNFSTWVKTSSHAANVYVADDGAIVRASSASKYKTNIVRSFSSEYGEKILTIPTATWSDKDELEHGKVERRYYGMIAEDLASAGLEMLVDRGSDGEIEGVEYDRIAVALIPLIKNMKQRIDELEEKLGA